MELRLNGAKQQDRRASSDRIRLVRKDGSRKKGGFESWHVNLNHVLNHIIQERKYLPRFGYRKLSIFVRLEAGHKIKGEMKMDYKFHSVEELQALKGKNVRIAASSRMMQRCRMHINGMYFRVVSVIENTKELFLEPLIPEFKDELQLLPLSLNGVEWGVDDISDPSPKV